MARHFALMAFLAVALSSCVTPALSPSGSGQQSEPRYLFAWSGDEDRQDSGFLAVIDLRRDGDRFGTIVATAPVGERGLWPHHTEHEMPASRMPFANGFAANRSVVFDLR